MTTPSEHWTMSEAPDRFADLDDQQPLSDGAARSDTSLRCGASTAGAPIPGHEARRVAVAIRGVAVTYGLGGRGTVVEALGPVDLDVHEAEFVSIVGPSGCGKSTLIKAIAGLVPPTSGSVELQVRGESKCPVATVFQDFGIFPWKTVQANVEFGLVVMGQPRRVARATARDRLSRIGLLPFADAYPATLSGGMRQRVAIARALAVEPDVLLMDEPFASLDAQLREILQEELLDICQIERRALIFVTHSLEEALVLSDRVVVMTARPGRILENVVVPFRRPRPANVRETAEFGAMRLRLWQRLRDEVRSQLASDNERRVLQ